MTIRDEFAHVLRQAGQSQLSSSAYDTAWVARLGDLDRELSATALNWIRENQLPDNSWGAEFPVYYHDRFVCTLSAILALRNSGDSADERRIARAIPVLNQALFRLDKDPSETVAFEMIVPTLVEEAQHKDILEIIDSHTLKSMHAARAYKLSKAPNNLISRYTTMAHSAEIVGGDGLHLLDIGNLQEANGSIGCSPGATAFYLLNVGQDKRAMQYLRNEAQNADKGFSHLSPIELFERAWILWNVAITKTTDSMLLSMCKEHLDVLSSAWVAGEGIGFGKYFSIPDGDDTALVFNILRYFGREVDLDTVFQYEVDTHFRTFELEANSSISTNVHVLEALLRAGLESGHPSVHKVINYLVSKQEKPGFWTDKWHASAFYTTSHAAIALHSVQPNATKKALQWILGKQRSNGSWGIYTGTPEETAYCLQALITLYENGYDVPWPRVVHAAEWLFVHRGKSKIPLWIEKCLYTPPLIVDSAILSALTMYERVIDSQLVDKWSFASITENPI